VLDVFSIGAVFDNPLLDSVLTTAHVGYALEPICRIDFLVAETIIEMRGSEKY
jgi:hypothetical protein